MFKYTGTQLFYGVLRRVRPLFYGDPDAFLKTCRQIVHVGANDGAERDVYRRYALTVLWVEALPNIFEALQVNLRGYPNQTAVNALVTDKEGEDYDFHVSSNSGASSSIYEFHDHKKLWPGVAFTSTVRLRSTTLGSLITRACYQPNDFDALILDVQGAEVLVLRGAGALLDSVRFIKAEASDFEAYRGACTLQTLSEFLTSRGFVLRRKERFAGKSGVGTYFDVLYERLPVTADRSQVSVRS